MQDSICRHVRVVSALILITAGSAAQGNSYTIADLGRNVLPAQISKEGIAGRNSVQGVAVLYRGGHWRALDSDGQVAMATAINVHGDVVGTMGGAPVMWLRHGVRTPISLPPGATTGTPTGVAPDGSVIGNYVPFLNHCFLTRPDGVSIDLGFIRHGRQCYAQGINGHDQITGSVGTASSGYDKAFLWENGVFRNLGLLPGGRWSTGNAINERGHIVGVGEFPNAGSHAFLWSGGAMKDLGLSAEYTNTEALALNDNDEIVGDGVSMSDGRRHALRFAGGPPVPI